MSVTINVKSQFTFGSEVISANKDYTVGGVSVIDEAIAGNATNAVVDFSMDVSQLKALTIVSTDADITIKTNDNDTPDDTLTIKAGTPFGWTHDSGMDNPFGADVDDIRVTNGTATATTLKIRAGYDPTV